MVRPSRLLIALLALLPLLASAEAKKEERRRPPPRVKSVSPAPAYDFSEMSVDGELGATPGGAKDISFFRDRALAGEIPHPKAFTPEGLFSEYDLPVAEVGRCERLFCATGQAMSAELLAEPEVRWLAQLGFRSGLTGATFQRAPLNLVAVVDKSGSMSGAPLDLVKKSLLQLLSQLKDSDQLSIVLYGDRSHVHLAPTRAESRREIEGSIRAIESAGSTAMEEGLHVGFDLARSSGARFAGTTRVMLFTDERPNVGRTDAAGFMELAQAGSRAGIGMTTVGVGVQFGAELAVKISSVRGGNLFFFPDAGKMEEVFANDLDTMVTELAHDLELTLAPASGTRIAAVYGVPGSALRWEGDRVKLNVATIFLSKKKGAIFVALAPAQRSLPVPAIAAGTPLVDVGLSFTPVTPRAGPRQSAVAPLRLVSAADAPLGLRRGLSLVDEATALAAATALHHEKNDQEGAYRLVHALATLHRQRLDPALAPELALVEKLEESLAKLAGRAGEPRSAR